MSYAFGHLIGAWLAGKAYEKIRRKELSHLEWGLLLLAGIIPDIDLLTDLFWYTEYHRTITHSLIFVFGSALLLLIVLVLMNRYWWKEQSVKNNLGVLLLVWVLGLAVHFILDMIFSEYGIPLFWTYLGHLSFSGIQVIDPSAVSLMKPEVEVLSKSLKEAILDMGLGVSWLAYLWWRKKIKF
jgi:membrane-bound metal-dependent hydrolase YbcI (DUF457 family)